MFDELIDNIRHLLSGEGSHYLVTIGIIIIIVVFSAYVFKRIGIPEALGFIIMGIIIGPSMIGLIQSEMITGESKFIFQTITGVALGFIGFHIGNEIKIGQVRKDFKSFAAILLGQALVALVLIIIAILGWVLGFHNSKGFYLVFLIAAVALPTAPAITASIIKESECRGPVTNTLMFVIGLDDVIGIIVVEFGLSIALMHYYPGGGIEAVIEVILGPFINIIGSIAIGLILGIIFAFILNKVKKTTLTIEFFVGTLLAIVGITEALHWSELLACMTFGFILGNMHTERNERAINYGEQIFSPVIMLFFVLAGASMDIRSMFANWLVIVIAIFAVISRLVGKWLGAYLGATFSKTSQNIRKYVGPGLLSQGEMTIGLCMMIYNTFIGITADATEGPALTAASDGMLLLNVLGLSILIFQVIGPFTTKWGLRKAGEIPSLKVEDELKPKSLKERLRAALYVFLNRIGIGTETIYIESMKAPETSVDISPAAVGDIAADVATGAIVGIATPAAIEAAAPAAADAAADAAVSAVLSAISEKAINNPLEAPLEEISKAVKSQVDLAVKEAVGEAVTSAITNKNVITEVEEAVEGAIAETISEYIDIEDLDVSELMDEEDLKPIPDSCELPTEEPTKEKKKKETVQ